MVTKVRFHNKKSQITIFVILALILIVLIAIIFLLRKPAEVKVFDEKNPQAYIESCTREATQEAIDILSRHGGDIDPKGSVQYKSLDITYLCYNANYYERCVNQRPLLVEHIENEITDYIFPIVSSCFDTLEEDLEGRYEIENPDDLKITTKLQTRHVSVEIDKYFKMTRGKEKREFEYFKINLVHPIYNFAKIAMEIVNQEIEYCNFDLVGYMISYPRYDIVKVITGDSNIIYTIKERSTNQKFDFAIRGCVLPPGF